MLTSSCHPTECTLLIALLHSNVMLLNRIQSLLTHHQAICALFRISTILIGEIGGDMLQAAHHECSSCSKVL